MHDLTGFQRDLLFVIAKLESPSGVEIKDELEKHYDNNIRHGRLYPNLDTLVNARLVKKTKRNDRSNEYLLRDRGKREIENHMRWEFEYCSPEIREDLFSAMAK